LSPARYGRQAVKDDERLAFVLEHTRLSDVPLVPELRVHRVDAVTPVWFELARLLDDDDADVPFWCVPWAGGQALARYVLDHPELVRGKRVLDFACGGGLVAMAASRAGGLVQASDIDPFARVVTRLNAAANTLAPGAITFTEGDLVGRALPEIDVLLAGDVWYEPAPSARFRRWFRRLARRIPVLTADSGRPYAPRRVEELARYTVPTPFELEARSERTARVLRL
jgi:predicted nicotinamide N-methyase